MFNGLWFLLGYIKHTLLKNVSDIHMLFLWMLWICVFKKYFLTEHKMALSSVILLHEIKSLVLTKSKTHQEISNILKERYPDMQGLSAMKME